MTTNRKPDPIDQILEPPPLVAERLIAQIIGTSRHAREVAAEIWAIQDGRIGPLSIDVDPLTATVIAAHLCIALEVAPAGGSDQVVIQAFLDGLLARIGVACPALGEVILSRRQRQGSQP